MVSPYDLSTHPKQVFAGMDRPTGAVGRQYHLAVVEKKDAELARLRAERDELRGAGIVVLGAWDMICDSHGWDADHMIEVKKARAILSRTEGGEVGG